MCKRLSISLVIFTLLVLGTTGGAYAYYSDSNYSAIYMVDSYGSYNEKTTFGWNETPYIYIDLNGTASANHVHGDLIDPGSYQWLG